MIAPDLASVRRAERQLTVTLATWGAASMAAGGMLWVTGDGDRRESFGRQTAAWGAADVVIAGIGHLRSRRRGGAAGDGDRRGLHRVLVVNSVLDVAYVTGGAALAARAESIAPLVPGRRPYSADQLRGDGQAIVVQGLFLLILDSAFALRTRGTAGPEVAAVA